MTASIPHTNSPVPTDKEAARKFLRGLDGTARRFTFVLLPDSGNEPAITLTCSLDELWPLVKEKNTPVCGMGVFVTISETNGQSRKASDIVRPRAVFVDADDADSLEKCIGVVRETKTEPSAIVITSQKKAHFYWFMDGLNTEDFARLQAALIAKLGTDPAVKDLSRIMRLPGTLHLKDPNVPQRVELHHLGAVRWQPTELERQMGLGADPNSKLLPNDRSTRGKLITFPRRPPLPADYVNDMSIGIECNLDELRSAASAIPPSAISTEPEWMKLGRAMAHQASICGVQAEAIWEIFDTVSRRASNYDEAQNRARWDRYLREAPQRSDGITVASVFYMARQHGWQGWSPPLISVASSTRSPINGGIYDPEEALTIINSWYFVGYSDQEISIFKESDHGVAYHIPDKDFKLALENIRVEIVVDDQTKFLPAEKFWRCHPKRREHRFVFEPRREVTPTEYNLWRGFGVTPVNGWRRQRRLLRHIRKVICRRDKRKFKYLMRWLAWAVQNPDRTPGTVIVLKSKVQGTGKTTLGRVMCDVFGHHGRCVDDKDQLLGQFNAELEYTSFVLAEEVFWAGDMKTADKLKSRVTSDTIPLEAKYRVRREVPNRMHVMITTNHEHAISSGTRDRRFFVLDVSDEHAGDPTWFEPLNIDLEHGGQGEFLWLLQNLKLGNWHPRQLEKTEEAVEQQRLSGDAIAQWCHACISADAIIGLNSGAGEPLGRDISTESLRESFTIFCKQHGLRPPSNDLLGKAMTRMFGPRRKLTVGNRRPNGYSVPDGDQWQKALDRYLAIEVA